MAFPDSVVADCWRIVKGVCEGCRKPLVWGNRGTESQKRICANGAKVLFSR